RELEAQLSVSRQPARSDQIAAAEAQARAARAELGRDQWRLDKTQQKSPAAGVIYDVLFRLGEQVPAAAPVVVLLPDTALKARFFVPQSALANLKVGASVALRCDGCAANLTGTVSFISPKAEFTPPVIYSNEARDKLVFMVEAVPDAEARAVLKPGMPLDVAPASR
ncbi:MAG: HlyD family secretion protein, partial [Burkholderiaceae bacterium]